MSLVNNLPQQQLPFSKKTKSWRKKHLDWAEDRTYFNYDPVRNSVRHKKINYDLLNGKLHMQDLGLIINPDNIEAGFIPEKIQHYPIINKSLNVLRGEELGRVFDYKVVVTNPNAINEIEETKKQEIVARLQQILAEHSSSQEEYEQELQKMNSYYSHSYQDLREIRGNCVLKHYSKELNFPLLFNQGYMDGLTVGEEIYQCDIVGGEPIIERVNPLKIRVFKSGYSNKIEDADIIVLEDYWSPGKIIDTFHEVLTPKDIKYIEDLPNNPGNDSGDVERNILNEKDGLISKVMIDDVIASTGVFEDSGYFDPYASDTLMPFDMAGNIRVLRVYWKSRRRIKKVKSYDPTTGEEVYNFYPETYIINPDLGEEEQIFYINEAWEGTKIGRDIYINMRPRIIQYNRLSNPSRCHFGIIGSIYNINDNHPFSMVDMMKQYNYLYDVVHDRLNKLIARNWGRIIQLDLAKVPKNWDIDKWMYYAKTTGIAVIDSFKEGNIGAATGKLAGGLNNASSGVIDAELGNSIQQYIALLEYIKQEMTEVVGISKQREGQISNRETVGGVERATLQSSHITEWLFAVHDDVKKRALECFLETAKIAFKGTTKKFNYILPDNTLQITTVDGDEFAESDYGLVVDNSKGTQELNSKLDTLAQAALQNQTLSFSAIMKLYNSSSLAEKQYMIEKEEQALMERQQQAQQQQLQAQQQQVEMEMQQKQSELQLKEALNMRDNETKIAVASIQAEASLAASTAKQQVTTPEYSEESKAKLQEQMRQFDAKMALEEKKFNFDQRKHTDDIKIKQQQIQAKKSQTKVN